MILKLFQVKMFQFTSYKWLQFFELFWNKYNLFSNSVLNHSNHTSHIGVYSALFQYKFFRTYRLAKIFCLKLYIVI